MKTKDFDYVLPKNLIAQEPKKNRDHSRLLCFSKKTKKIEHEYFYNVINYFKKGDVLVLNNSKVFPARLIGNKKETNGQVEVFLVNPHIFFSKSCQKNNLPKIWECLLRGKNLQKNLEINFKNNLSGKIVEKNEDNTWEIKFNKDQKEIIEIIEKIGQVPLPPYIKRDDKSKASDKKNYQTIYANNDKIGSVAAPTAGFHFTPDLVKKLKKKGVEFEYLTLHIGLGTFSPVKVDEIKKHKIHTEYAQVSARTIKNIIKAKKEKRRIIAVGTTSVRVLEGVVAKNINQAIEKITDCSLSIDIFIYPGYKFKVVDAMITNFHLPKSTLLMLVSAFTSLEDIQKIYQQAIAKKYRFFSYGDAMFLFA